MNNKLHYTKDGWRDQNNKRICTIDNETIEVVIDNCKEFLTKRDTLYIQDIAVLLEKALEGVADKKDISPAEQISIQNIRKMIKGL